MNILPNFLLAIICLSLFQCISPEPKDSFTLKGKINGQDTGLIVLRIVPDSVPVFDTVVIRNGRFVFRGTIHEPMFATLIAGNDSNTANIYIDPAVMNIELTHNKFSEYKMTGSKTQEENELLKRLLSSSDSTYRVLAQANTDKQLVLDQTGDPELKKCLLRQIDSIDADIIKCRHQMNDINLGFVKSHLNSYLSPSKLLSLWQQEYLSLDSTNAIFTRFDFRVKESKDGKFLMSFITMWENLQIGVMAPEIKAIDIHGNPFLLSQFRGKNVILIEFWASWCRPCRSSFPMLKSLYSKYHPKGFDIVAIANFDTNMESWERAVKQERVEEWHHLATIFQRDQPINSNILHDYPMSPIPIPFLIDKSGEIVGNWKGYNHETEKELTKKLNELLSL